MSEENVERIRRGIEAFNSRDFGAALGPLRNDVTWARFLSRTEAETDAVQGKVEAFDSAAEALDAAGAA